MSTIVDRGYVFKKGSALVPTFLAFAVIKLLEEHFPTLVDYSFTARMEEGLDQIAGGEADDGRVAAPASTSATARHGAGRSAVPTGSRRWSSDLGDIDAREINSLPDRLRRSSCASAATARTSSAARSRARQRPRGPGARRADRREGRGAARRAVRRLRARHRPGDRAGDRREVRPLRPVRHRGAARGRAEDRQAAHRVAVQGHEPRHGHARGRAAAADAAARRRHRPRRRRRDHRAERPLRPVPEEGHRLALARAARSSCSRSPSTRRSRSTPSPSSAAGRPPRRRCASSAPTP